MMPFFVVGVLPMLEMQVSELLEKLKVLLKYYVHCTINTEAKEICPRD
jgi:hypothetical protein